jgi:hypothetical protein
MITREGLKRYFGKRGFEVGTVAEYRDGFVMEIDRPEDASALYLLLPESTRPKVEFTKLVIPEPQPVAIPEPTPQPVVEVSPETEIVVASTTPDIKVVYVESDPKPECKFEFVPEPEPAPVIPPPEPDSFFRKMKRWLMRT